jgi:LysM domain
MRKWTKSACVVIAWSILALVAMVSSHGPGHPVQASSSIASSTQQDPAPRPAILTAVVATPLAAAPVASWTVRPGDTLSSIAAALHVPGGWEALYNANRAVVGPDPNVLRPGITLALTGKTRAVSYDVAPGDTLTAIAAALAVPGGWQALYAANRTAIGPDPDLVRAGTSLVVPRPAAPKQPSGPARPASGGSAAAPPAARTGPGGSGQSQRAMPPSSRSTPGTAAAPTGVMPGWVKATLLAAGLLTLIAFIVEPVLLISRRRRHRAKAASPRGPAAVTVPSQCGPGQSPAERITKIIQASHERLIVTYSVQEDTVYLLTPPGEDPRSILRAARLVMPEDTYEELAEHLGVPSGWRE